MFASTSSTSTSTVTTSSPKKTTPAIKVSSTNQQEIIIPMGKNNHPTRIFILRPLRKTLLGQLSLGCVDEEKKLVVIKISDTSLIGQKTSIGGQPLLENPEEENRLMKHLTSLRGGQGHPGILKLFAQIQYENKYEWTVLEYCAGGDLFDVVNTQGAFPPNIAKRYFRQIVEAVNFLHLNNITHLDLSLENILIGENDQLKICDFGLARELKKSRCTYTVNRNKSKNEILNHQKKDLDLESVAPISIDDQVMESKSLTELEKETMVLEQVQLFHGRPGKRGYMAPEIYKGEAFDGCKADVWSCGVILFLLLTGIPPWTVAHDQDERYRMIMSGFMTQLLCSWKKPIPPLAMDLFIHIFCPAEKRWNIQQVMNHRFITSRD